MVGFGTICFGLFSVVSIL
ncbi:hypothetical protein ACSXAG_10635 [Clostridium perfringens]|nr:hypothetical protein [Clostridium perfringens]HAT4313462.1 hypothetical protein [Clostridium perfringens]